MKVLVVPDVHGSHEWESVKDMPTDSFDFIVFNLFMVDFICYNRFFYFYRSKVHKIK